MKLERVLPFARTLLQTAVKEGDYAVDATLEMAMTLAS